MPETILAFDYGLRRIGVATGQPVTRSASPLAVVRNGDDGPDFNQIGKLIAEWRPACLVVGMPAYADGSPSPTGALVAKFVEQLRRFGLPVQTTDERYSSVEAERLLKDARRRGSRRRVRKEMVDSTAAVLIAERWLAAQ